MGHYKLLCITITLNINISSKNIYSLTINFWEFGGFAIQILFGL